MGDAVWVVPAAFTVLFVIGALASSGALTVGWLILAVGMAGVTYVRYKATRNDD